MMSLICSRLVKLLESIHHPSNVFSMLLVRHTCTASEVLPLEEEKKTETSLILLFLLSFAAPEVSLCKNTLSLPQPQETLKSFL